MTTTFAPDVPRQRLLVEGRCRLDRVDERKIREAFAFITARLALRAHGEPIIFSPAGEGRGDNQGYDAFLPLIDSSLSLYIWTQKKFVSSILYNCKSLDEAAAVSAFTHFFEVDDFQTVSF